MIKFQDPIYEKTFYFTSDDKAKAQKKVFNEVIADRDARGWFIMKDSDILIQIPGFNKSSENLATLAHEVNHAVDYVMEEMGIEDSEAKSYYAGFITKNILDGYSKRTSKSNKKAKRT